MQVSWYITVDENRRCNVHPSLLGPSCTFCLQQLGGSSVCSMVCRRCWFQAWWSSVSSLPWCAVVCTCSLDLEMARPSLDHIDYNSIVSDPALQSGWLETIILREDKSLLSVLANWPWWDLQRNQCGSCSPQEFLLVVPCAVAVIGFLPSYKGKGIHIGLSWFLSHLFGSKRLSLGDTEWHQTEALP